jgi:hypothetical protein
VLNFAEKTIVLSFCRCKKIRGEELERLIRLTRLQLNISRLYLQGEVVDPSLCFRSTTASPSLVTKLYTLLPVMRLTKKFVTFDAATWKHIFDVYGYPLVDPNDNQPALAPGIDTRKRHFSFFDKSLNFGKVRLKNW